MLCAPVTYDAALRQLICLPALLPQFGDRGQAGDVLVDRTSGRTLLGDADEVGQVETGDEAAAEVRAERADAAFEEQLARRRRGPRPLLHALVLAASVRLAPAIPGNLRGAGRTGRRRGRSRRPGENVLARRGAARRLDGLVQRAAFTRQLLVPEAADAVPRSQLRR